MRRSICYTEPSVALAGERNTWKFVITPSVSLPKNTLIRFDLGTKGRVTDWEVPSINSKDQSNIIWAQIDDGKKIIPHIVPGKNIHTPFFDFVLPSEASSEKPITIFIGTPIEGKEKELGNKAQSTVQRRRTFNAYIDPSGKGQFGEAEPFVLDVKGNSLSNIRIITPSIVTKNKRFDVILRFEDRYGNLTNNAPEDTLIEISHDNLRENLQWRLFVPETGFITLPNLYFNDIGTYCIRLKNLKNTAEYVSSPIKCFTSETTPVFWGSLHGESERYDAKESIEHNLRHFRDEKSYNFYATSSLDTIEETSSEQWKTISEQVKEFSEDERFCALLGQQYSGEPKKEGQRILLFAKDDRTILRRKESRSSNLKKVYGQFSPHELISIPFSTMSSEHGYDFSEFDPEVERLVEIYNAWGSCEFSSKEKNPFPPTQKEFAEGSIVHALKKNCRFGFVAGGLDDRGIYSTFYDSKTKQYPPGLTGIVCDRLSKQTIFEALYQRKTFATTGPRILANFSIAGHLMGSELSTVQKPGIAINRHISGFISGTAPLKKVEIIRNGEVLTAFESKTPYLDFTYDDMDNLCKVSLLDKQKDSSPFSFYYVRAIQEDGHMVWTSPIWIDSQVAPQKKNAAKPKHRVSSQNVIQK